MSASGRRSPDGGRDGTDRDGTAWTPEEEPGLTARSVVASTLLGVRPPRLSTRVLVGACGLFGISAGTARVAISRMMAAGELEPVEGGYALTGPLLARSARQDVSAEATTEPWSPGDGWTMAIVAVEDRTAADRTALRRAARGLRLAELREGVWARPDNLRPLPGGEVAAVLAAQCERWRATPEVDEAALARRLWDLDGWTTRADRLMVALDHTGPRLARDDDAAALPEAFVLSAAVVRHLQSDPLLPDDLLPSGWPGPALRAAHRDWRRRFEAAWEAWVTRLHR